MINLYDLKYFVDAAKLQSMTKASELNRVSRPAISLAIQRLEADLGMKLIVHKKRLFELTQAGAQLVKNSGPLFDQVLNLKEFLKPRDKEITGDFRIGSSRTLATFNLPEKLIKLKKQFPLVNFRIFLANSSKLIEMLDNKEVDLIFFVGDETLKDYKSLVVRRGHFCLIKPTHLDEQNVRYALSERRPETERARVLFERKFNRELPTFAEVHSWDAIWTWVNNGVCGGLVPDFLFKSSKLESKYTTVIPKVFPFEIKAMFSKAKADNPVIRSFLETSAIH